MHILLFFLTGTTNSFGRWIGRIFLWYRKWFLLLLWGFSMNFKTIQSLLLNFSFAYLGPLRFIFFGIWWWRVRLVVIFVATLCVNFFRVIFVIKCWCFVIQPLPCLFSQIFKVTMLWVLMIFFEWWLLLFFRGISTITIAFYAISNLRRSVAPTFKPLPTSVYSILSLFSHWILMFVVTRFLVTFFWVALGVVMV